MSSSSTENIASPYLQASIEQSFGVPLGQLLAPIGEKSVGENVRHNGVYFNIKEARQQDDPTLPTGVWSHELKTADWPRVRQVAVDALCHKSKDLQLGVWLFEANIHLQGFAGIAPASGLIMHLCEQYWAEMHPQIQDGDIEYRTNPISWLDQKVTPQLRLLPLTHANYDGNELTWDDWENALRHEQLKAQNKLPANWEGLTPKAFKQRLAASDVEHLGRQFKDIEAALSAVQALQNWFDETCGNESPNLSNLSRLLDQIQSMFHQELSRRGVRVSSENSNEEAAAQDGQPGEDAAPSHDDSAANGGGGSGGGGNPANIRNRADAFACLQKAADFLMRDDPHSPVPYLVFTACDWGERSAPDLYKQLFLEQGGQLNIFEIMGLEVDKG